MFKPVSRHDIRRLFRLPMPTYPRAAIIATTGEGVVMHWNAAAERLYGWTATQALSRNIIDLTASAYTRERSAEIMAFLQAGRPWAGEMVLRRRNGLPVVAYVMDFPIGDLARGQGAVVGVSVPISQKRMIERHSRAIAEALRRRLSSAGEAPRSAYPGQPPLRRVGTPQPHGWPGVYARVGPTSLLARLHRRAHQHRDLWSRMQRVETYRYRAETLARRELPGLGAGHLRRMWRRLALEQSRQDTVAAHR
ncbi:MAG TPA: PAS domain-containing protein [Phenylobacterium sp.]